MFAEFIDKTNGGTKSVVIRVDVIVYVIPGCKVVYFGNLEVLRRCFC